MKQAWTDFAPPHRPELSQYHTPPEYAARLAELLELEPGMTVLEPSAGGGSLVKAALDRGCVVVALELDPQWAAFLRRRFAGQPVTVLEQDFLEWDGGGFQAVIMNPPYEGGQDGDHLAHATHLAPRVGALVLTAALHGVKRHDQLWCWERVHLARLRFCVRRPFAGEREYVGLRIDAGARGACDVGWWL